MATSPAPREPGPDAAPARLRSFLESRSIGAALLSNPATITWLTGYSAPIESGPSPFEGGPALAWVEDGAVTLIVSDAERADAERAAGGHVADYAGYTLEAPIDAVRHAAEALAGVIARARRGGGEVAIELDTLPGTLLQAAERALGGVRLVAIDNELPVLRAVKSAVEIARLRASLELCDIAHAAARGAIREGVTEIDLWNHVRTAVERAAGGRVPALVDVVAGSRAAEIGGPPTDRPIRAGDAVILDVVLRRDGYWGDTAATWFAGEPVAELRRAWATARTALRQAVDAVRPGVEVRELDTIMRSATATFGASGTYPHHSGHGLGTTYHDPPRIVPYATGTLAPGMVITLEPGIYLPGIGGVRLEDVVLVTDDGSELLSRHLVDGPEVIG
ncbi:MAG: Xaa-Pro peptidase family protein [Chloroflexi bacterium]|nr:Xaa-Pro peptidase family protein [Chloroflexota bacterium]